MAFSRNFCLFLALALCATAVCADTERERQERSIFNFVKSAGSRIKGALSIVADAVKSSISTVVKYGNAIEDVALSAATNWLKGVGIDVDLEKIVNVFKNNLVSCYDENTTSRLSGVKNDLMSCVSVQSESIQQLISDMDELWETAQKLPQVMEDVSEECKAHLDGLDTVYLDAAIDADDETHDLAVEAQVTIEEAQKVLSKRAAWDLERAINCVKSVYSITKNDLNTIPSEIMTAAGQAFEVLDTVKSSSPTCLAQKVSDSIPSLVDIAKDFGKCSIQGVKEEAIQEFSGSVGSLAAAVPKVLAAIAG